MEPYIVLADKQVNGHRRGLAFSALPDAPVLAPTTPGVLRRQATRGRANMNVAGPLLMATPRDPSSMTRALGLSGRFADVAAALAQ